MYVVYINDHLGNSITQLFEINNLNIQLKLNDISSASFTLSTLDKNCKYEYFKEYNRIKICRIENNIEKVMIDGICRGAITNLNETKISINCNNFLLKKKILYTNKTYSNQTIKEILQDLVDHINSRDNGFITLNCDVLDIPSGIKEYKTKKTLFDIIKDLAGDKYEFVFNGNELLFKNTIGSDKSTGNDIVLFEFDINSPDSRTILKAENEYDSDNIANGIIGENGSTESIESINNFGRIEEGFSSGDKEILLEERKNSIRELDIQPLIDNFFICELGDIVKTYIYTGSDMMYYDGGLKVIEKIFKSGKLNTINIKLNTGKVKSLNLLETLSDLKIRVKNLEI